MLAEDHYLKKDLFKKEYEKVFLVINVLMKSLMKIEKDMQKGKNNSIMVCNGFS